DFESVFVFVDKNTKKVNKVIGSAHIGNTAFGKTLAANNELSNPKTSHATILIEKGSHANWPDGNNNGLVDKFKDISNFNAYGNNYLIFAYSDWSIQDKLYGAKINWDNSYYNLIPLEELKKKYTQKYDENRDIITKSPELGFNLQKLIPSIKEKIHIPIGGESPKSAWSKEEYYNSNEVEPYTTERLAERAKQGIEKIVITIKNEVEQSLVKIGNGIANEINKLQDIFSQTSNFIGANIGVLFGQPPQQIPQIPEQQSAQTTNNETEETINKKESVEVEESQLAQLQEIIDDLAEEIDIFSSKIQAKLAEKAGLGNNANAGSAENSDILGQTDAQEKSADSLQELAKLADEAKIASKEMSAQLSSLAGSGSTSANAPHLLKLLISEATAGVGNAETEYIEIYNPNNAEVEINSDNFQLKLVNSKNEISTKQIKWLNNKISSKGYFLFCSTSTLANNASTSISVDAVFSDQLTDTSGIILADKNYNQDLDKLSWGSSDKPGPDSAKENQAISLEQGLNTDQGLERKKDVNNVLIDTDNNSEDFVLINSISVFNSLGQTLVFDSEELEKNNKEQSTSSPKILITEIQIEGAEKSEDFIELYNASSSAIDISNWQLKKRSKTGTESSVIFFDSNTFIAGQSYFLWASKKDPLYPEKIKANVSTTAYLTENNSIALLDKNDRVVDAAAWGSFGATSTEPFFETEIFPENPDKGFSLQRKYSSSSKEYQDTDNNKQDFQTQKPSPKAKNFLSEIKIWLGDDYAINAWQYIINWQAVDETDEQLNYYQIETKQ
ncbi:lamin tail domain-containing protein, partial [Patescibacteria group bacterium]|nr:lamin tail domain-containing protein [Patescibacteria group bacterium]